jgi:hypothetical protein
MIAQFLLAQVPGTSLYSTGSSGSGTGLGVMVAVGVGVLALILFAVLRNGGISGSSSSFNKGAFRRAARGAGLAEEEVRSLEEYGKDIGLTDPEFVFRNAGKLDAFFQEAYRRIDRISDSEADAEERKAMLFAARERLTHSSAQGGAVKSTRQLGRGSPLTFIAPGEESYPSVVLAIEPSGLVVEAVTDSYGEAIRFRRGTKLTCFFYAKGHEGYQFPTQVSGWEKMGGKDVMVLSHSEAVSALPARRHARREMKAPCTYYRLAVTASEPKARGAAAPKGQRRSSARVENFAYPGTIVDISAGGLGIQCANPLATGEYVKIAFNPGGGPQAAYAKVIRMNKLRTLGGVMHVQFVKISRQSLNAILSYVYGYVD